MPKISLANKTIIIAQDRNISHKQKSYCKQHNNGLPYIVLLSVVLVTTATESEKLYF
jgi:hypothetical protein